MNTFTRFLAMTSRSGLGWLCLLAMIWGSTARAQDLPANFSISALTIGSQRFDRLELDIEFTSRFVRATGVLSDTASGLFFTANGSCLTTPASSVHCTLYVAPNYLEFELDGGLSGPVEIRNASGSIIDSGTIAFLP